MAGLDKSSRAPRVWEQMALFRPVSCPSNAPTSTTILCRSTARRRSLKRQLIVVGLVTMATFSVHMSFALFTKLAMIITSIALEYYKHAITSSLFRRHFLRRVSPEWRQWV